MRHPHVACLLLSYLGNLYYPTFGFGICFRLDHKHASSFRSSSQSLSPVPTFLRSSSSSTEHDKDKPQADEFDWSTVSGPPSHNRGIDFGDDLSPGSGSYDSDKDESTQNLIEDELGNIHIPSGGFSVSDYLDDAHDDQFDTKVVPVENLPGVAQLVTSPVMTGSFEPLRYLVALTPPIAKDDDDNDDIDDSDSAESLQDLTFVMVDIPPFSIKLELKMKEFMGKNSKLAAILVTSKDSIHYDSSGSVYSARRSDLDQWTKAFPNVEVVTYRLDTPRDCRDAVTQCLDGYGPFALHEDISDDNEGDDQPNFSFKESGRPLTRIEWDPDVAEDILSGKRSPDDVELPQTEGDDNDEDQYTPEAIRLRENSKRCLAIFTPGHTFGSISYVFPETKVCCAGYTIPIEDTRAEANMGGLGAGPAMDCRGYITTSTAGISKQMVSARKLIHQYADRFEVVLSARGDPLFLDNDVGIRKSLLIDIVDQYDKIGRVYEQLGLFDDSEERQE